MVLLLTQAGIYSIFISNCGGRQSCKIIYHKMVVGDEKENVPCQILLLQQK